MRDQYVGDITDFLKYALLRALAGYDRKLGVAWYFNPSHDGGMDGRHTACASDEKWSQIDEPLRLELKSFQQRCEDGQEFRTVKSIQTSPFWPAGTVFHGTGPDESVPDRNRRAAWTEDMCAALEPCRLLMLDPDVGTSLPETQPAKTHAWFNEVKRLRRPPGRSIVLVQFPPRIPLNESPEQAFHAALSRETGATKLATLMIYVTVPTTGNSKVPSARWFTLVDYDEVLLLRLRTFHQGLVSMTPPVRVHLSVFDQSECN